VAAGLALVWIIYSLQGILAPFVLAFVLSYVLTPLVDRMEGRGVGRTWSILIIFLVAISGVALGLFTLGSKLKQELGQLIEEFMREESVVRGIVISNAKDGVPVVINGTLWQSSGSPFSTISGDDLHFELVPGKTDTLRFRFAPGDVNSHSGRMKLTRRDTERSVTLRFLGNKPPDSNDAVYADPRTWDGVTLSSRLVDFGSAGPNIITRISAKAQELEPLIQQYTSTETDLASLIKEHGSLLINKLLGRTTDLLSGVFSGLIYVIIVPFVAFFFMKEGRRINHGLVELVPNAYFELFLNLLHQINGQIGGYIRGQLLAVTIVASVATLGLQIIGLAYALPVGLLAGLSNMIPYVGPLIGIVSASIVAIAIGGGSVMVTKVIILFLAIQVIDNVLIQPLVVARSVNLHPLVVLVVVMIGSDLMGLPGMLIAVPVTGILKVSSQAILEGVKGYRAPRTG
jgi:predicted PurR-regulated permease PerM